MDVHQPEASSSTSPPPAIYQATLVFDSGLSRERFAQLIETNGIVHKLVLRLMDKCGGETSLRIGLVITAQDAAYPDPRALHSIIPAYRQDFRRPSALLTSLPSIVSRFSPQAVLDRGKPGSLLSDIWDIEDGAGLSISSSEPGASDYFLSGLVAAVELLEHHSLPNTMAPPGALQALSPPSALPMLSMVYKPHTRVSQQSHLIVFTEKASLAAIDSDSRGSQSWARGDSCAIYDDIDWDTIGERCKAKDIACSCVIMGSGDQRRGSAATLGRDGSASAEKLRKMCQASTSSGEGQDEPWFPLPSDSDIYLTGFAIRVNQSPPAADPAAVAADTSSAAGPTQNESLTEAQLKFRMSQKQAMAFKMAQSGQQPNAGQANYNVLASLLASGRLDGNVMAQLVANVRSEDPAVRQKAVQQLTSLMSLQKQSAATQQSSINSVAQATAALSNAGGASGLNAQQQQQFMAAMQQRAQAAQAAQAQANQQANQAAQNNTAGPQAPGNVQPASANNQQTQQQATAQQLQQQQMLLQQQRAAHMAAQQNAAGAANRPATNTTATTAQRPSAQTVWSGSISWTMKGATDNQPQKWVIPVDCMLLSTGTDASQLQTSVWPQNLEMAGMSQMNMTELQTYVKANQAPCVLFTVSPEADPSSRNKMNYLTMTLGSKSLCAFIRFGGPGCGILLISSNQPSSSSDKLYRLLGVVCLKVPFNFPSNAGAPAANAQANAAQAAQAQAQHQQQQQQQNAQQQNPAVRPATFTINGPNANANSMLQAQMQSQLLQHQQQQQQNAQNNQQNEPQQQGTPGQQHARTPSQNLGTPHSQGLQTPQQIQQPRLPSNPQVAPSTLQQFASQPNVQTIQQLQLRQLQAQAAQAQQQSGFQNQNQQAGAQANPQQNQTQAGQQPQQPQQNTAPMQFSAQQRAGIVKLLRDAGMNVPDTFDPNVIPRDTLIQFMQNARTKQTQQQMAAAAIANNPNNTAAQVAANMNALKVNNFLLNSGHGINGAAPSNYAAIQQAAQAAQAAVHAQAQAQGQQPGGQLGQLSQMGQGQQGQMPGNMPGLQLGQLAGLQQFQQAQAQANAGAAGGAGQAGAASALGLFAAQQGLTLPQFQQVGLGQFQQH